MMTVLRGFSIAFSVALLSACAVGPNYKRPPVEAAPSYKELDDWKPSEPNDVLNRGPWWNIFHDDVLDGLEKQIDISNQTVKSAAAAVEEAQAIVRQSRAGFWPSVTANGSRTRTTTAGLPPITSNRVGVSGTWNIDVWGQIRRQSESSHASEQSSEAALAAARLSAQAELAADYFELRAQDQLQVILTDIVAAQEQSLKIAQNRYRVGVAAKADVVSAQTELLTSQAQQVSAKIRRSQLEHAIAVLVGSQPATFSLAQAELRTDVPTVPPGVPSALLERRPDIAEFERRVAQANAQIGVAKSAYFPALTLTGSDDYTGSTISKLIRTSNQIWAVGPAIALSLFDGGLRRAQVAQARAAYEVTVDDYRQTVLTAFEQVEDSLVSLRVLEQQAVIEDAAVKAAREAETLTLNQYKAGTIPYSSVISAQTARLNAEVNAINVLTDRLTGSVTMIQALGGGWDASQMH
jgi:NodT family efflux transporter outer membrane factor (OMF) lipoprotein